MHPAGISISSYLFSLREITFYVLFFYFDFKKHFETARDTLKKVRGPTLRNTHMQQVNVMTTDVMNEVSEFKQEVMLAQITLHHKSHVE